jgi:hypothetical protein
MEGMGTVRGVDWKPFNIRGRASPAQNAMTGNHNLVRSWHGLAGVLAPKPLSWLPVRVYNRRLY